jgi:nitrate/TMAO reductase-like tetraheme cytochrome c subunit
MTDTPPAEEVKEEAVQEEKVKKSKKNRKLGTWAIVGIVVAALVVVGGAGGGYLIHLSNTSPEFCATCHIMDKNVTSYLTSNDLDNIHYQANVECKECHDYPIPAEISSGIKFVLGNYTVDENGDLMPVTYGDDICLQCHISKEFVAQQTDFLTRNPHNSHNGMLPCKTCHVSHGAQIDYCSQCHDNGGQRMVGDPYEPRDETID